jgi:hypothetical protein
MPAQIFDFQGDAKPTLRGLALAGLCAAQQRQECW